ncbi:MAG: zf-TFIIB domain-containing protein [Rhodobacteraceae bacterium]|nr:zf-TFIIB domain-containing protein [Paracoccaceae bacterium]
MRCPVDGAELTMAERQGVEIDYCPKCRGVWLDRGELDKIIDRSTLSLALPEPGRGLQAGARPDPDRREARRERRDDDRDDRDDRRKRRKKSFLSELFDFD